MFCHKMYKKTFHQERNSIEKVYFVAIKTEWKKRYDNHESSFSD